MLKTFSVLLSLSIALFAITPEAVKVYRPISLYGTASAEEHSGELIQAKVESFFTVITGAMPEDLMRSIKAPTSLPRIGEGYVEEEANLILLTSLGFQIIVKEENHYTISLDTSKIQFPEGIEITLEQLLELTISSIRRTLNNYYLDSLSQIEVQIEIEGLEEKQLYLKELEAQYTFGSKE